MKLVKKSLLLIVCLLAVTSLAAQEFAVGEPNAEEIGIDSAQQKLKEVSVTKYEDAGFWKASMALDNGLVSIRRLPGGPLDKEPIPEEEEIGISQSEVDKYVLGVKVEYFKRGFHEFLVTPARPMAIEGITKTISVWVVGRNNRHTLKLLISDYFGNRAEITMGSLNFTGWKKMTVAIPPHIIQRDYHHANRMGIRVDGFKILCDPVDTYGDYYIYFDDMRAVTDLYSEESRDVDDMQDSW
ncbi:flagellar filament outer layer protein FlaA [Marispirochaeta aestuarii]|uniref:flagellar filament outer layer protein FlaA n=1 Tax=Marispirochaeta aestuarii TaxID=1963862 RepID=UPI0029C72242|nr:flagellar filament outer layer protein FlaA [Marispirochaeta aestuarii]